MRFIVALIAMGAVSTIPAQEAPPTPCSAPEFNQFDFWVGEWDLSWEGGSGVNRITRPLGNCVVQERFSGDMGGGRPPFNGLSVSVYDPQAALWRQTWVDNNGGYLTFTGGLEGEDMVLYGGSEDARTRMIFTDITPDSLTWHWERSTDGGKTWESRWVIEYRRRAEN